MSILHHGLSGCQLFPSWKFTLHSHPEVRRKGNSASATNQESTATGEIDMEFFFCGSLTTIAKKDKDKKQQKVIPVRRSDWIRNATKSDFYLYKQYLSSLAHWNLRAHT
ncbi:hypothetical protein SUGI_0739240 [Cryptomeria japonica]|nr:hypothetical protein SUGI_0739240 [Cryptomeria japonica]